MEIDLHKEQHLKSLDFITDNVIGMPAGLSGAFHNNGIIITAGTVILLANA